VKTKEKLAQVLHAAGLFDMEKVARAGRYDDYESEYPTPILDLVDHLRGHGNDDLARRAMDGEWDASKEESDAWAESEEGRELMRGLGDPKNLLPPHQKFSKWKEGEETAAERGAKIEKNLPNRRGA